MWAKYIELMLGPGTQHLARLGAAIAARQADNPL
jgi:hypothetical protein